MVFNGINNQKVEFTLIPFDPHAFELMTGIKVTDDFEHYDVGFNLVIGDRNMHASIFISDVKRMVDWFEALSLNKSVDSALSIYHSQLCFNLLKNDVPAAYAYHQWRFGIYSRLWRVFGKLEEILKMYFVECELNNWQLQKIAMELKSELHYSF